MAALNPRRPFAVVTGASSGSGRELARLAAQDGHDLAIAAGHRPLDEDDLSTPPCVAELLPAIAGRPVGALAEPHTKMAAPGSARHGYATDTP